MTIVEGENMDWKLYLVQVRAHTFNMDWKLYLVQVRAHTFKSLFVELFSSNAD
jgi:hypothetical protein